MSSEQPRETILTVPAEGENTVLVRRRPLIAALAALVLALLGVVALALVTVHEVRHQGATDRGLADVQSVVCRDHNVLPKQAGGRITSSEVAKRLARLCGAEGPSGANGAAGQSFVGPEGPRGARGPRGAPGAPGSQGSPGPPGVGVRGERGPRGPRGHRGSRGRRGPRGAEGPVDEATAAAVKAIQQEVAALQDEIAQLRALLCTIVPRVC